MNRKAFPTLQSVVLCIVAASGAVKAASSSIDAWDISQGSIVTTSSPTSYGVASNMFGDNHVDPFYPVEVGHTLFQEGQSAGFVNWVEWNSASAIQLGGYNLTLIDDFQTGERGISLFSLYGRLEETDLWQLLDSYSPAVHPYSPYGPVLDPNAGFVEFEQSASFSAISAKFFRAEFTQYSPSLGVRVAELDAIVAVPEPSCYCLLISLSAVVPFYRKRSE